MLATATAEHSKTIDNLTINIVAPVSPTDQGVSALLTGSLMDQPCAKQPHNIISPNYSLPSQQCESPKSGDGTMVLNDGKVSFFV